MHVRWTVLAALALALAIPASAPARQAATPKAPSGLKAFLLSYTEPASRTFSRTPSFGWKQVKGATGYEFQLATSSDFRENSILYDASGLKVPYVAGPLALPWTTGNPYSLFARVRASAPRGTSSWSADFGFNVRSTQVPAQMAAPAGLLRWTPIDGASEYEVSERFITGASAGGWAYTKNYFVATNVTDMRDWYTFHQDASWTRTAFWRVRAVRLTYGASVNDFSAKTYGPWSPYLTTTHSNPVPTSGPIALGGTVSNVSATVAAPKAHGLMPGFYWNGSEYGLRTGPSTITPTTTELYRVYIFSDHDCVHSVYTGAIVGSPAWVPRATGPLELALQTGSPGLQDARGSVLPDKMDGEKDIAFTNYYEGVLPTEGIEMLPEGNGLTNPFAHLPQLGLWDRLWPSGAYYWTVVPVEIVINPTDQTIRYVEGEYAQDACAAGRIGTFGRVSAPIGSNGTTPYVTGLSTKGVLKSTAAPKSPKLYGHPLVAWTPAMGADIFQVQWSPHRYPFPAATTANSLFTPATSASLPLRAGTWYYRIRGVDFNSAPNARFNAWSTVRRLTVAKPVFRISR